MYICLRKDSENQLIKMIENDSFSVEDILIYVDKIMYNEYKEGYDKGWKYNRKQYRYMLAEKLDYKCECCNNNFNLDELVIHHVKPHKGDVNLMHDFNNMLLCCPSCHTLIHKRLQYHDETNKSECWKAIRESMIIKRTY